MDGQSIIVWIVFGSSKCRHFTRRGFENYYFDKKNLEEFVIISGWKSLLLELLYLQTSTGQYYSVSRISFDATSLTPSCNSGLHVHNTNIAICSDCASRLDMLEGCLYLGHQHPFRYFANQYCSFFCLTETKLNGWHC